MSTPNRNADRLFRAIREMLVRWPDLRVGQIVANAVRASPGSVDCDPFYCENDLLAEIIERQARDERRPRE